MTATDTSAPPVTVDDDGTQMVDAGDGLRVELDPHAPDKVGVRFPDDGEWLSTWRYITRDQARALARLAPALRTFAEHGTLIAPEAT